ncbi:LamG domain-containing protein [Streptomyces sp. H10-C2]|uniref:LamG domain-containing protein n=1 Tax=unclassified Streptomyces TaxID=2593676 RepID=UPI0024BA9BEE|nr:MULTISPECIES: LamG domain-containing protein [unclassified Streptomyces]MDJ0343465.1 LamG domain-containing protein [Streptomyces sp. PH10-H1]MDJ0371545.1 LamG domain-containing protein [Streptomyces sp. H10-C2]
MSAPTLAAVRMGARLTTPFDRGADSLVLQLLPGAGASVTTVRPYDFADHQARFGLPPEPRYVLATARDVVTDTVVTVTFTEPGKPTATVTAMIRAGTPAGASVVLDLPASAQVRVTSLAMTPAAPDGRPDECWRVTALLGTLAKLLWVIGGERDQLRGRLVRTLAQRHLPTATGRSLDLIGTELGVPRFPPLPYGFDADTVALYHLDDVAGAGTAVQDVTGQYPGRTGHPGVLHGPVDLALAGRYGRAFGFAGPGTWVEAATAPAFDIAATGSATVECFVRPDAAGGDGQVLFRHPAPGGVGAGWVLSVGEFGRGLDRNVRLSVGDGTTTLTLFADLSLPPDTFTHLAGVLDRAAGRLALYADGKLRSGTSLGALGPVANTAPLRIGPADSAFRGVIDEVRISAVARADFSPVLGEADEHYRRRLRLFRRWALPTPANLAAMLNELVGTIGGMSDPLVVEDTDATLVRGTRLVHIRPVSLLPGECIDAAGRRRVTEADTVGTAAEEEVFDPAYLLRYDRAGVDFSQPPPRVPGPGERPADPHLIQVGLAAPLDQLIALAGAEPGPPGRLRVGAAFDPQAPDLRVTGRAALVGHSTIAPGRLAALAHRAGFDYVCHRADPQVDGAQVYVANAPGDYFAVDITPAAAGPTDLDTGSPPVVLSLRPIPPADTVLHWLTVPNGIGGGLLSTTGAQGSPAAVTTLKATAPGGLLVKADLTRGGHTISATRPLRIGLLDLPNNQKIDDDGTLGAPANRTGDTGAFFDSRFLVRHNDQRVDYGSIDNNHLMQPAVAELLDALLAELARRAVSGQLRAISGFQPGGDPFSSQGRTLTLRHTTATAGALGAMAHAVGFGHVEHTEPIVKITQAPGELVVVHGPAGADDRLIIEVDEGATVALSVQPALPSGGPPGQAGADASRLGWATGAFGTAHATLDSLTQPTTTLRGDTAGIAWVQASYLLGDLSAPYTFRVGLRSELDRPDTVITKDQYDLILNILNALHPVGIEVNTRIIRDHTIEVRGDLAAANPDFTYPKFRVRSVLPPLRRDNRRG